MLPLSFLVQSPDRRTDLASILLAKGAEFGAQTSDLGAADISRWRRGRKMPVWARAAVVSVALERGWRPDSGQEIAYTIQCWRLGHRDGSFAAFVQSTGLDDTPELRAAWRLDVANYP